MLTNDMTPTARCDMGMDDALRCLAGMTWDGAGSDCGVSVHLFDELEGRRLLCVKRSDQIHNRHRYRRYRIVGLLPAVVLVAGGLYLGLTNGSWIPLLLGCSSSS